MAIKMIFVISLILSMLLVPSTASVSGIIKCSSFCLLECLNSPICLLRCCMKCKKSHPLDVEGRDDHSLCLNGCVISNYFTNVNISETQGNHACITIVILYFILVSITKVNVLGRNRG